MTSIQKRGLEGIDDEAIGNRNTNNNNNGHENSKKRRKLFLPHQPCIGSPTKPRSLAPPSGSFPVIVSLQSGEAPTSPAVAPPSSSYYLSPQLSLGSGGGEIETGGIGIESNLPKSPSSLVATAAKSITKRIGSYEILHESEDSSNNSNGGGSTTNAVSLGGGLKSYVVRHVVTDELALCRCVDFQKYSHYMNVFRRLTEPLDREFLKGDYDDEETLEKLWPRATEIFSERDSSGVVRHYIVTPRHFGTLHTSVINKKKMNEDEAKFIYRQVVQMMAYCHDRGVVVRDVKLRKFVFVDEMRRQIRLNDLDELYVCPCPEVDTMKERHGCPAYVSPEIIDLSTNHYAGKPADVWGLGVLLYVLLVGRYPFYDTTPSGLFGKIRSAKFAISEQSNISYELRCIIRCLLRKTPEERPSAQALLKFPWLSQSRDYSRFGGSDTKFYTTNGGNGGTNTFNDSPVSSSSTFDPTDVGIQCVPCLEPRILVARKAQRDPAPTFRDQELYADSIY